VHNDSRLYRGWKLPILEAAGFKCVTCARGGSLHAHHYEERMADIIHRFMDQHPEETLSDPDVRAQVVTDIIQYHIDARVPGVALCEECHQDVHRTA
jgi:hypothetical protein